ncbi:MAG: hypothetical protein Q4B42_01935 [Oscillospiraceae bacterium]|nr:hypothetical protein [Oscillospiraceae bacterium]
MSGLQGRWLIKLKCSLGEFSGTGEIKQEGDSFSCSLCDESGKPLYHLTNGQISGRSFSASAKVKQGLLSLSASMKGLLSEDGQKLSGTVSAMGLRGSFEGERTD